MLPLVLHCWVQVMQVMVSIVWKITSMISLPETEGVPLVCCWYRKWQDSAVGLHSVIHTGLLCCKNLMVHSGYFGWQDYLRNMVVCYLLMVCMHSWVVGCCLAAEVLT